MISRKIKLIRVSPALKIKILPQNYDFLTLEITSKFYGPNERNI